MLYTASKVNAEGISNRMKRYYIMFGHGNDEVSPDPFDLDLYKAGELTWQGLLLNYQVKLRKSKANIWMQKVSSEAVHEDIILVDSEEDPEHSLRVILAQMMASMFSGQMGFRYNGELK